MTAKNNITPPPTERCTPSEPITRAAESKATHRSPRISGVKASLVECYSNHITTRISIQTAGSAFGGTGLCSCRVRGVDDSRAEHLNVESYTVIYASNRFILIIISFPPPTLSFIPDLKPSFSANPSHCSLSFSSSRV